MQKQPSWNNEVTSQRNLQNVYFPNYRLQKKEQGIMTTTF